MCRFMSKTLIKRCQPGQRQTIQHEGRPGSGSVGDGLRRVWRPPSFDLTTFSSAQRLQNIMYTAI